jgi:hypothetical protein
VTTPAEIKREYRAAVAAYLAASYADPFDEAKRDAALVKYEEAYAKFLKDMKD